MSKNEPAVFHWLHLSDFHFRAQDDWRQRLPLNALIAELATRRKAGWQPQALFLTGDIAFSGKQDEYDQARIFFKELAEVLDHNPKRQWFLVPGNHDVDRLRIKRTDDFILRSIEDQDTLTALFKDDETMELLARRLETFYQFTGDLLGPARRWQPHKPWRLDTLDVGDRRVGVLQLNGVWAGGLNDDKGRLMIGEHQLLELTALSHDADVRFALAHHPLSYLTDFDETRSQELLGGEVQFFLRGHLHRNTRVALETNEDGYTELAAGAVLERDPEYTGAMIGQLDLHTGEGHLELLTYSNRGTGAWVRDTKAAPDKAPQGLWSFRKPVSEQAKELTEAGEAALTERYREAVMGYHGNIRFIGLAESARRPRAGLEEIFVPLRLTPDFTSRLNLYTEEKTLVHTSINIDYPEIVKQKNHTKKHKIPKKTHTTYLEYTKILHTNNLIRRIMNQGPLFCVILGDPGSGKSTLAKYLAVMLAERRRIPILIPFREYVTAWGKDEDLKLMDYIRHWANRELNLDIPQSFIEEALDQGRAVLIFDGMDEVGSPERREIMRNRIQALCRAWPKTPAIITSRIAGYDQAGLDPKVFEHWKLADFSDEEQADFVTRWYAVQETDPKQRDERTKKLVDRLKATPAARELARNPLMATLLALVHFYRFELPGQRARLYQLCVETLVETWPAQRGKSFEPIDARLQIEYLAEIAWRMQQARTGMAEKELIQEEENNILISREKLGFLMEKILKDRIEKPKKIAKDWLEFLSEGSGLFLEQQTGFLGFFHLSLLEYLAAAGMPQDDRITFLLNHWNEQGWREVCLLHVGIEAENDDFLSTLYQQVETHQDTSNQGWDFLLLCAREEANFTKSQINLILFHSGQNQLERSPSNIPNTAVELCRYSKRHGEQVELWRNNLLAKGDTNALQSVTTHFWRNRDALIQAVTGRHQVFADAWLDFFPGSDLGNWAFDYADPETAQRWIRQTLPGETGLTAMYAGLSRPTQPAVSALALRALADPSDALAETKAKPENALRSSAYLERSQFHDIKHQLHKRKTVNRKYFARSFALDFARRFALKSNIFTRIFTKYFLLNFARNFTSYFAQEFEKNLSDDHSTSSAQYLTQYFAQYFALELDTGKDLSENLQTYLAKNLEFSKRCRTIKHLAPNNTKETNNNLMNILGILAAETWFTGCIAIHLDVNEQANLLQFRVGNRATWLMWPVIEESIHKDFSPYHQALYLAIGYRVATSVHDWPPSERWSQMFKGPPPEFWLARAAWYACWLLYNPDNPEYRQGYEQAVEAGRKDSDLPGYADAMPTLA